jgi:hypothetical protein
MLAGVVAVVLAFVGHGAFDEAFKAEVEAYQASR